MFTFSVSLAAQTLPRHSVARSPTAVTLRALIPYFQRVPKVTIIAPEKKNEEWENGEILHNENRKLAGNSLENMRISIGKRSRPSLCKGWIMYCVGRFVYAEAFSFYSEFLERISWLLNFDLNWISSESQSDMSNCSQWKMKKSFSYHVSKVVLFRTRMQ